MRIDTRPRKRNAPRPAEKSCPAFLQWLRGRTCVFSGGGDCEGKSEAAHIDFAGDKGIGTKVSDKYALPMCSHHHRAQHDLGWVTFATSMRTTKPAILEAANRFWAAWPGRIAWERKQETPEGRGMPNKRPGRVS